MSTRARLAAREFDKDTNISIRKRDDFKGSTLHGHDFYELDIVIAGNAQTSINGKLAEVNPGCIFLMTPADFHEYSLGQGFDLYNIQFTGDVISNSILERFISSKTRKFSPDSEQFRNITRFVFAMEKLNKNDEISVEIATRLLECILLSLSDALDTEPGKTIDTNLGMQRAITFIHEHFKENPTLREVARTVPLNERYFCTKFREYTGHSYKEYLTAIKLRYARRLILATSLSMIEIANTCGYGTQSNFNREFKKYYGATPRSLRRG